MGLVSKTKLFENVGSDTAIELLHSGSGILLAFTATWIPGTDGAGQTLPLTESSILITLFDQSNKQITGTLQSPIDKAVVISQSFYDWSNPYSSSLVDAINTIKMLKPASGNKGIGVFLGRLSMDYVIDTTNNQPQSMNVSYSVLAFE